MPSDVSKNSILDGSRIQVLTKASKDSSERMNLTPVKRRTTSPSYNALELVRDHSRANLFRPVGALRQLTAVKSTVLELKPGVTPAGHLILEL
jgi:hypothetical protein